MPPLPLEGPGTLPWVQHGRAEPLTQWLAPGRPDLQGLLAGWQDAEFMRDVEAATGEDLGSARCSGKGRGRKRQKYPGLTDLKGQADTARTRIGKKVFAK